MRIQPSLRAARSKREEQSRLIRGEFYHANFATLQQLLVTQSDHRIDACCTARGNAARHEGYHAEYQSDA